MALNSLVQSLHLRQKLQQLLWKAATSHCDVSSTDSECLSEFVVRFDLMMSIHLHMLVVDACCVLHSTVMCLSW